MNGTVHVYNRQVKVPETNDNVWLVTLYLNTGSDIQHSAKYKNRGKFAEIHITFLFSRIYLDYSTNEWLYNYLFIWDHTKIISTLYTSRQWKLFNLNSMLFSLKFWCFIKCLPISYWALLLGVICLYKDNNITEWRHVNEQMTWLAVLKKGLDIVEVWVVDGDLAESGPLGAHARQLCPAVLDGAVHLTLAHHWRFAVAS